MSEGIEKKKCINIEKKSINMIHHSYRQHKYIYRWGILFLYQKKDEGSSGRSHHGLKCGNKILLIGRGERVE